MASRWSLRHTGIYHHHDRATDFDLWIMIHPVNDSILERRLIALTVDGEVSRSMLPKLYHDPFKLHLLVYSSYFDNWRWYLQFLGEQVKQKVLIRRFSISFYLRYLINGTERDGVHAGTLKTCLFIAKF